MLIKMRYTVEEWLMRGSSAVRKDCLKLAILSMKEVLRITDLRVRVNRQLRTANS